MNRKTNRSAWPNRAFVAAAVACWTLGGPAHATAHEPPDGDGGTPTADARPAVAAAVPEVASWDSRPAPAADVHEEWLVVVTWTEEVSGFTDRDVNVENGSVSRTFSAPGRIYNIYVEPDNGFEGEVTLTIPAGSVKSSSTDQGNERQSHSFEVDNRAPEFERATVDRDELVIRYDEDLNERSVPRQRYFTVLVEGNTEPVDAVEVDGNEVILELDSSVDSDDDVVVSFDQGAWKLTDETGNEAESLDRQRVANITDGSGGTPGAPRSLEAEADGTSVIELDWLAPRDEGDDRIDGYRIQYSRDGGDTWRTLVGDTGDTDTDYRDTGLSAGTTRHYRVAALNSYGRGEWSRVANATTEARVPGPPENLRATARGASSIELDWDAPSSVGASRITGYRIEVSSTGSGNWRDLVANTRRTTRAYTDSRLTPGTRRYYRVSAINAQGTGAPSDVASATTATAPPGAPTGLSVTAPTGLLGRTQLVLRWTRPSSDGGSAITGYLIQWSETGVTWRVLVASTGTTGTTYTDLGLTPGAPLTPGTRRYYRVAAINAQGTGPFSSIATGTTNASVPSAPRSLRAIAAGSSSITLSWEAPADDGGTPVEGYRIEGHRAGESSWRDLNPNTRSASTTWRHTGLDPATSWRYRVSAINSIGTGPPSAEAGATTAAAKPGAPTGLMARAQGTSRIDLSWRAPRATGGARILGYRIEVSDDGGTNWRELEGNTGSTATTFQHTNLRPATTRHYRVSAINEAGTGPPSNVVHATTEAIPPGVPRSLTAEAEGTSQIDLSWQAPLNDGGAAVTGYRIEVSEDVGASWRSLVANTGSTRTVYSHTGLAPATTRHYRVSAINRIGVGRTSRVAGATTDATVPDAPTGLAATAASPTRIDLVWVAPAYDGGAPVTGYRVEVSETGAAWVDLMPNTGSVGTAFSHTDLLPGSTRHYRVSAINRAGTGAPSASASAATDDPVERAGRLNTRVLPHVAAAMTSSTVSAIAARVDAVARGMGMERRIETNGLSSMAASLSAPGAGGLGRGEGAGLAALFGGTSFQMPFGASDAPQQSATGTQMASWGAGEYHYLGEPAASALDWKGNMVSAHVGVDARVGPDILAGLAASYSSGSFDFTDKTGAGPVAGTYGATMTGVHPYLAWFSGARGTSVWGSAGLGWGDLEVDDEREGLRTSPARTMTGAAGGSYQLFTSGVGGVRVKAEGWAGRVMVDGSEQIDSVTLNMQRGKLALELTQGFRTDTGHEMTFLLEGGVRQDNGDGVNGTSAELGAGFRYTNSTVGLTAEGRGRFVISARDGYEEWGLGGMLQFDPAARGRGLSIRVAPSYGDHRSGVNQLWERGVSDAVRGHDLGRDANVDGEVAYGITGSQGTPYGGFYLTERGVRAFSSGVRYELGSGVGLRLEGTRRESGLGAPQHTIGVRGRLRFR